MTRSDLSSGAPAFRRALLAWFKQNARDLPWRRTRDPYAIWLSEIILQQTRVEQGTPYYERFLSAFPTVEALANAPEDRVLKAWEGLGYYTRARNLHKAAKAVAHEHRGQFPRTRDAWQALPGIGRYTAGAIASIAFDERVPVLDGNVIRVLARLLDLDACTDDVAVRDTLWTVMEQLVPPRHPGDFNQAMMELGARVCTPKAPQCAVCPVSEYCAARAAGTQELRPVRRAKASTPHHEMVAAAIKRNGRYLLAKRPAEGLLGGLWEFPSGRVRARESHARALVRELQAQFGVRVKVRGMMASVQHAYSHFKVTLTVYGCDIEDGKLAATAHDAIRWIPRSQLDRYALPKVVHKFVGLLP